MAVGRFIKFNNSRIQPQKSTSSNGASSGRSFPPAGRFVKPGQAAHTSKGEAPSVGAKPKASSDMELLGSQKETFDRLKTFCDNPDSKVFILSGYAGTGKTTLLKFFVDWLSETKGFRNAARTPDDENVHIEKQFVALASTGRAAKVLSDKIGHETSTVHSHIYSFEGFNRDIEKKEGDKEIIDETGQLYLNFGFDSLDEGGAIYIVDESSMISDTEEKNPVQAKFGSGKLLTDLLSFAPHGKFIFVGDPCQLPPVQDDSSPALNPDYIQKHFGYTAETSELTEIIRQAQGNDIIEAASKMRRLCLNPPYVEKWAKFPLRGYQQIKLLPEQQVLIDRYATAIKANGYNAATMLTLSNKNCTVLSSIIRGKIGFYDSRLMVGELLLVTQNNSTTGLMNGDLVRVNTIGSRFRRDKLPLTFLRVGVEEITTGRVYNTILIEDLIYSSSVNLDAEAQKSLFIDFYLREKEHGIKQEDERFKEDMRKDPYLNALRAVWGYALTCHKAQGGEWPEVYLDFPRFFSHTPQKNAYQWLYTAITRAKETLYINDGFYIGQRNA